MSLADMDNLKEQETNKLRLIEYTWYDWTINYFLEPIKKITDNYNDKIDSFLNINTPKKNHAQKWKETNKPKT